MKNVYKLSDIKNSEYSKALSWYERTGKSKIFSIIATCQAQEVYKVLISSESPFVESSGINPLIALNVICSELRRNGLYSATVDRSLHIKEVVKDVYNLKISWFR